MDYICIIIPVCSYRQQLVTEDMELIGSCASNPLRCILDVLLRFARGSCSERSSSHTFQHQSCTKHRRD